MMKERDTIRIAYRDRWMIVVEKPFGLRSEEGAPEDGVPDVITALKAQLGLSYLAPLHRLDAAAGGLLMLGCDREKVGKLSAAVAERQVEKDYLAVVHGRPEADEGEMRDLLFHDSGRNRTFVVQRMRKGVREASLSYRVLGTRDCDGAPLSLVRVRLHTGRTHQIRVQFSSRGMSLYGDGRYGARDGKVDLALWSYRLSMQHPLTGKPLCVEALPEGGIWACFEELANH